MGKARAEAAGLAEAGSGLSKSVGQPEQPYPLRDLLFGTKRRQGMVEAMAKQAARSVGGQIGNRIVRGLLGGITQSR